MSESDVWKYYSKCDTDDNEKKARCLLCDKICSYTSTIYNLKSHIYRRHSDEVTLITPPKSKRADATPRKNNSFLWFYFSKLINEDKVAACNICNKNLSYKTTISNLKKHLSRSHGDEHKTFLKKLEYNQEHEDDDVEEVYFEASEDDEDSNQSKAPPDVWSFFEQEAGGRARCAVCRATLPHRLKELRKHLKSYHPKLAQDIDDDSDDEDDQNDTYTEVVYLEDESRKPQKREPLVLPKRRQSYKSTPILKRTTKRRTSSSSEECLSKKDDDIDDQIDKFGTYVTCLLKKMPKDVCTKLQMDIINLIMTTKLKLPTETSTDNNKQVIIDGLPVTIQPVTTMPATGYIVTVPSNSDCVKQNISVASDVKDDPLTENNMDMPKISVTSQDMTMHNC